MLDDEHDSDVDNDEGAEGSGGGYRVIDTHPEVPLATDVGDIDSKGETARPPWFSGDLDSPELDAVAADVADLGANVYMFAAVDPMNALITAGLTFLIDVVQPLEDLLGLVTGNAERMDGEIKKWQRVANALPALAGEIDDAAARHLVGWKGRTGDAARDRLGKFSEGVKGISDEIKKIVMILSIAKAVMDLAQQFVIGLIAQFVEWLLITWSAAIAAAGPTFGGSTVAAAEATEVEGTVAVSRGVAFLDRVTGIFERLQAVLREILPKTMAKAEESFVQVGSSNYGKIPLPQALTSFATSPGTYVPWLAKDGPATAPSVSDAAGGGGLSDKEIDRDLDSDS